MPQVKIDLDHILQEALTACTTHDELSLIRVSLRRYSDTGDAKEAVAWAAQKLSDSLTSITSP